MIKHKKMQKLAYPFHLRFQDTLDLPSELANNVLVYEHLPKLIPKMVEKVSMV